MKKQAHIIFTGSVQGVGFRFTTLHTANKLGLVGWVRNMENGSVEALAEGEEETIKSLIQALHQRFEGYIRDTEIKWSKPTDEFLNFDVGF